MKPPIEKRRAPRIPFSCRVVIREGIAAWATDVLDVSERGCRIALKRPLAPGTAVHLCFERDGEDPFDVVGKVAWSRSAANASAGIAFVNIPRQASGARAPRHWIDALVACHLARLLASWPASRSSLARMFGLSLRLGLVPADGIGLAEAALLVRAREGVPLPEACCSAEKLSVVIGLLRRGVVSVCLVTPDPEGWKEALPRLAASVSRVGRAR